MSTTVALVLIIYLSGCITSYLYARWYISTRIGGWYTSDRATYLFLSILSWIALLVQIMADTSAHSNKKAKW